MVPSTLYPVPCTLYFVSCTFCLVPTGWLGLYLSEKHLRMPRPTVLVPPLAGGISCVCLFPQLCCASYGRLLLEIGRTEACRQQLWYVQITAHYALVVGSAREHASSNDIQGESWRILVG